jgi:CAAX prenyl protease-like protein
MQEYLVPFILYLGLSPVIYFFTKNEFLANIIRILGTAISLYIYRTKYTIKIKFGVHAILFGCAISLAWVAANKIIPISSVFIPLDDARFALMVISGILVAPIIEELFTRNFLIRFLIDPNWKNVKVGTYSLVSFIITVLFFGFSHQQWLGGLITGILLNILLYIKKDVGDCILAHAVANAILIAIGFFTGSWQFW